MDLHQNFIDGRFHDGGGEDHIAVLNPARDNVISHIPDSTQAAVDEAVAAAKHAQGPWEKLPAIQRANYLRKVSAKILRQGRTLNTGQVCNAPERVYVDRKVADQFVEKLVAEMRATRYGDPLGDTPIDMGPIINKAGVDKIKGLVDSALHQGAHALTGGKVADLGVGNHFEPTVLVDCRQDMDVVQREVFGPVLPVVTFDDLDQAIAFANDTTYGLTSSIYTTDIKTALRACNELRFGETYVNRENFEAMQGFHAGRGRSGIGGADGKHGLYEHMQTHIAYIQI